MALTSAVLLVTFGVAFLLIHAPAPTQSSETCGPNEEYSTCGSRCPEKCNVPAGICTDDCRVGCFCKKDYILDENNFCITKTDCGSCSGNTTYLNCGSSCPKTCSNMNEEIGCIQSCSPGCSCKKGYVFLKEKGGSCVLPQDCPSTTTN